MTKLRIHRPHEYAEVIPMPEGFSGEGDFVVQIKGHAPMTATAAYLVENFRAINTNPRSRDLYASAKLLKAKNLSNAVRDGQLTAADVRTVADLEAEKTRKMAAEAAKAAEAQLLEEE